MKVFVRTLVFLSLVLSTRGQLEVVYEWVSLDYTWPSPEVRQEAIDNGSYVAENNALAGIKVRSAHLCLKLNKLCDQMVI